MSDKEYVPEHIRSIRERRKEYDAVIRQQVREEIAQEIRKIIPYEYSGDFDEGVVSGMERALRIVEGNES